MKERKYSFTRFLGIIGIGLLVLVIGFGMLSNYLARQKLSTEPLKGITYTREAYVSGCKRYALANEGVTDAMATSYCGCVYDQGTATYGATKFSEMDNQLTLTNNVTPEMNTLINNCIVQIGE